MKYLYPYECDRRRLSTPQELQAAIDGNRREGRRSSYGHYEGMSRSPNNPLHISPLTLVTQQHQQLAARMMSNTLTLHNGVHHPTHPQPMVQPINGAHLTGWYSLVHYNCAFVFEIKATLSQQVVVSFAEEHFYTGFGVFSSSSVEVR